MERFPHPDRMTEDLIQWFEASARWQVSQGDAQITARCRFCGRREYFHMIADQQFTAEERKNEIENRPCCRGGENA
jgi:hypothetical protein